MLVNYVRGRPHLVMALTAGFLFVAPFLAFALSVWERLSAIMVGLFLRGDPRLGPDFDLSSLFAPEHFAFVIPYMLLAGIFAAVVFALSVATLPMLIDRHVDLVTALMAILWVVRENLLRCWSGRS